MPEGRDWVAWHDPYDDAESSLSRRLRTVQELLAAACDDAPPGPIRVISICAGQGHDLLGVLEHHVRRDDVVARLVELAPANVAAARARARRLDSPTVEVVEGDAGTTDAYRGVVPADVVLACGVFGNIGDDDIHTTIDALPSLCAPGALVLWTRHRLPPDATSWIRTSFEDRGFDEVAFVAPHDEVYGIGAHRLRTEPAPFAPGRRLFRFVGYDDLLEDSDS